ncbi:hypothetical protein BV20DRAFT_759408 [Pilatotrama ljubarskyi]|nr:hypothetical protein BV20DRAFT_759408 [Pilatotrama ljubarskyi]
MPMFSRSPTRRLSQDSTRASGPKPDAPISLSMIIETVAPRAAESPGRASRAVAPSCRPGIQTSPTAPPARRDVSR